MLDKLVNERVHLPCCYGGKKLIWHYANFVQDLERQAKYWIRIYEILEVRGLEVYLVNARHVKMAIIRDIVAGQRDSRKLAAHRNPHRANRELTLTGGYRLAGPRVQRRSQHLGQFFQPRRLGQPLQ
jgi:hypothetical protein